MYLQDLIYTDRQLRHLRNEAWELFLYVSILARSSPNDTKLSKLYKQAYARWLRRKNMCARVKYPTQLAYLAAPEVAGEL